MLKKKDGMRVGGVGGFQPFAFPIGGKPRRVGRLPPEVSVPTVGASTRDLRREIGRASCGGRGQISGAAGCLKKKMECGWVAWVGFSRLLFRLGENRAELVGFLLKFLFQPLAHPLATFGERSEERRVGEEGRSRGPPDA